MDDFNNNNYTPAPRGDDNMEQPEAQQAAQPQESGQQSAQAPYRASDEPSVTPQGEQEAQPQQPYGAQGEQQSAPRTRSRVPRIRRRWRIRIISRRGRTPSILHRSLI